MQKSQSPALQWLDRIGPSFKWRYVFPNIANPFDSATANGKLEEYASDRGSATGVCQVRAWMDDTIVLTITDIVSHDFETTHPNLASLRSEELAGFLKKMGLADQFHKEVQKFQDSCRNELTRREHDMELGR